MNLQEIFDQLTFGELSQLSIGGGEVGVIDEANYPRVIPHVNLALTALYKRFPIKENRLILELVPDKQEYILHSKYAIQNTRSTEPVKYILDTADRVFNDDILKIETVKTDLGEEVSINDYFNVYAISTPTNINLRIPLDISNQVTDLPDWLKTTTLEVIYRANHPKIVQGRGFFNPARINIELPDTHLEPLLLFIAARMLTPLGSGQLEGFSSNTFLARYEAAALAIETLNLKTDQGSQSNRLRDNGFP